MNYLDKIKEAAQYIRSHISSKPKVGMILGSGLGALADEFKNAERLDYSSIPHFPLTTVEGHAGKLVVGELEGKTIVAMQGRFHFYEGYSMKELTFPVRVMKELGVNNLVVTNACGGINPELYPGALMVIKDHINFMGDNPLMGENHDELGPRFPDMSTAYDKGFITLAEEAANSEGIELFKGIYTAVSGPYYFSKAELDMVRRFGSDTIGMSTVPEIIVAAHAGMRSLGICCVTDMAIPEELESINHAQVVEVANRTRPKFIALIKAIIKGMDRS